MAALKPVTPDIVFEDGVTGYRLTDVREYALAGRAHLTIKVKDAFKLREDSKRLEHFYIIRGRHHYSLCLLNPVRMVGCAIIGEEGKLLTSTKHSSFKAIWDILLDPNPRQAAYWFEFYHRGRCGRCGCSLKRKSYLETGFGHTCRPRPWPFTPRRGVL